ncbi:unnamed protein product, partial [Staurois parvus]
WGPRAIRGSWDPCALAQTQKKPMKRYQGHLMGPPTDPGPSGKLSNHIQNHVKKELVHTRGGLTTHGAPGQ